MFDFWIFWKQYWFLITGLFIFLTFLFWYIGHEVKKTEKEKQEQEKRSRLIIEEEKKLVSEEQKIETGLPSRYNLSPEVFDYIHGNNGDPSKPPNLKEIMKKVVIRKFLEQDYTLEITDIGVKVKKDGETEIDDFTAKITTKPNTKSIQNHDSTKELDKHNKTEEELIF